MRCSAYLIHGLNRTVLQKMTVPLLDSPELLMMASGGTEAHDITSEGAMSTATTAVSLA